MKHTILLLLLLSATCYAQEKKSLVFSAYESREVKEFENIQKELAKLFRQQDSLKITFLKKYLIANNVDLTRVSDHKDSLKISDKGIELILKPIKK